MARRIDHIVVHHSATGLDWTTEDIRKYHIEQRGWIDIGYHFVVEADGRIMAGRDVNKIGAHCKNKNRHSIGVCAIGDNTQEDKGWTTSQKLVLPILLRTLTLIYPNAQVVGHRDLRNTACPGFDFTWHG